MDSACRRVTGRDSPGEQAEGRCDLLLANSKFVSLVALHPEIGAATTVALTVTGQQLASAVIDGRGLFRMPQRPLARRGWPEWSCSSQARR
jgi:hypothetical protein